MVRLRVSVSSSTMTQGWGLDVTPLGGAVTLFRVGIAPLGSLRHLGSLFGATNQLRMIRNKGCCYQPGLCGLLINKGKLIREAGQGFRQGCMGARLQQEEVRTGDSFPCPLASCGGELVPCTGWGRECPALGRTATWSTRSFADIEYKGRAQRLTLAGLFRVPWEKIHFWSVFHLLVYNLPNSQYRGYV